MVREMALLQEEKALTPMVITEVGIMIEVRD